MEKVAEVLRCYACNTQITIISGPVPETCETCGRVLVRFGEATISTTSEE